MPDKRKVPILGGLGDRLNEIVTQYSRLQKETQIYDESAKTLDLTRLMPPKELSKMLQSITTGSIFGESMFEKFFDLALGRSGRYSEYEQIYYRIPEAAESLHIYVDSTLSPNLGERDNEMLFNIDQSIRGSVQAKELIKAVLNKTNFFNFLPQIIFTTFLYGDTFVEIEPTKSGIRYIIHPPKYCTILHDEKTDIELGLIVQVDNKNSKLMDMLSAAYPSLSINVPERVVAIVSDKKALCAAENRFQIASLENQIKELIADLFKDYGAKYKYLPPHRYVRFPIYYNNLYYPYGTSIFDPVRSVAKQLLLVESALSMYRATRTPLRTLWTIEVGSTPEDQIPTLINGIMNRVRRERIIDPENGQGTSIDSIPDMMTPGEDVWSPSINGTPLLKADPLESGSIETSISDADYFKTKLIASLGIPPSYLASEQGASTRALLTLEDIRFSRTIKKYQSDINIGLQDLVNTCFNLIGHPQYADLVSISLPKPQNTEDNIRIQNLENKLSTASSFMTAFPNVPKIWIMKNIIGFSDDDIEEMNDAIIEQSGIKLFSEQIPGQMSSSSEIGEIASGISNMDSINDFNENINEDLEFANEESSLEDNSIEGPIGDVDLDELGSENEENNEELIENEEEIENL